MEVSGPSSSRWSAKRLQGFGGGAISDSGDDSLSSTTGEDLQDYEDDSPADVVMPEDLSTLDRTMKCSASNWPALDAANAGIPVVQDIATSSPDFLHKRSRVNSGWRSSTDNDWRGNITCPGPALAEKYKVLLDSGLSTSDPVKDFRDAWKGMEEMQPVREVASSKPIKPSDGAEEGDLRFLRGFTSSGRSLLNANEHHAFRHATEDGATRAPHNETSSVTQASPCGRQWCDQGEPSAAPAKEDPSYTGSSNLSSWRRELESRVNSFMRENESWRTRQAEQVETLVEQQVQKLLMERVKPLLSGNERAIAEVRRDLARVRDENQSTREGLRKEQQASKLGRVELQNLFESGLLEVGTSKKEIDTKCEDLSQKVAKVRKEARDAKAQLEAMKSLLKEGELVKKSEFEALEERVVDTARQGKKEREIIVDRVEHLSQLYLSGLENVRSEVMNLKKMGKGSPSVVSRKFAHLENAMKDAVEATVKLQRKYSSELDKAKSKWKEVMDVQVEEARAAFRELEHSSECLSSRIEQLEQDVAEVRESSSPPEGFDFRDIQNDLRSLGEQVDALTKLRPPDEDISYEELGARIFDATKSRKLMLEKMNELGRKFRKMESAQANFTQSLEDMRTHLEEVEDCTKSLTPKYEATEDLLKGMDTRLLAAECSLKKMDDKKEMPASGSRMDVRRLHTKVETLEGRVEHVTSATFTNLRILDSKVESYRAGVQSAIEGAATAESKCSVLGAEIVKVFRMLAARNGKTNEQRSMMEKQNAQGGYKQCKTPTKDGDDLSPYKGYRGPDDSEGEGKTGGFGVTSLFEAGREFKKLASKSKEATFVQQRLVRAGRRKDGKPSTTKPDAEKAREGDPAAGRALR